jgi:hypothetical protein
VIIFRVRTKSPKWQTGSPYAVSARASLMRFTRAASAMDTALCTRYQLESSGRWAILQFLRELETAGDGGTAYDRGLNGSKDSLAATL